jgi:hypothetical protein
MLGLPWPRNLLQSQDILFTTHGEILLDQVDSRGQNNEKTTYFCLAGCLAENYLSPVLLDKLWLKIDEAFPVSLSTADVCSLA